ncbi:MAG: GTP-binding DUF697 domain-containing protein [Gammaproteobacteria bacterium]|nr:GTP-binding DUF697 domain-containing protein [Gammaproteobacteria bacterium]
MSEKTPRSAEQHRTDNRRTGSRRQSPRLRLPSARFAGIEKLYQSIINPPADKKIEAALRQQALLIPTLWLLGKTGAGKSSIIQVLTELSDVDIGNGFEPCTRYSHQYDFPPAKPVLRFLDTRGLGEAGYDPVEDLRRCQSVSHAVLAVMRVDDPLQQELADALATTLKVNPRLPVIAVHTHLQILDDSTASTRAIQKNQQALEQLVGRTLPQVAVDFATSTGTDPHNTGREQLVETIAQIMPSLHALVSRPTSGDAEHEAYQQVKTHIAWYAGVAAASDAVPALGLVTVPGIQGKMLHSLAQQFGIEWNRRRVSELLAALGTSVLYRYSLSLAGRQVAKLVPVYGQTVGSASAASISFISTMALGRAASRYLYAIQHGQSVDADAIRTAYKTALSRTPPS